jgi:hypothetical protein
MPAGHDWGLVCFTTVTGEIVDIRNCRPDFDSDGHFPDITEPDSFFPIHIKCLSLVNHVVARKVCAPPNERVSSLQNIQSFYQVLDCLRPLVRENPDGIVGKGVEWTHGYYGARRFWFDGWTMERGWEFLVADPFNIPDLTEYLLSNLDAIPIPEGRQSVSAASTQASLKESSCAGLDALPVELLDRITSHLSLRSILRLHRTSRALSQRISLGQAFWRDQLVSRNLVPFLWDLDSTACREKDAAVADGMCWDWGTLTQNILQEPFVELALKDAISRFLATDLGHRHSEFWKGISRDKESKLKDTTPLGLVNRVRIVKIIEEAMKLAQIT